MVSRYHDSTWYVRFKLGCLRVHGLRISSPDSYKKRVERAYLAAQEVLGSLAVASEQVAVDVEKGVQEVEVKCYDSDSLSSPPPSSDESDRDLDPLLDFSRNDDLTHQHGTEGPAMVRSAIHAQRALEGIQSITRGVQERRQNEEEKSRLVSTQAMFTPVFPKSGEARWQPAAKQPQDRDGSNPWQRAKPQQETTGPPPVTKTELSAERQLSEMAPYSRDGAKSHEVIPDRPPPIPSYNPERPDSFLLSNKPEYQIADRKKTSHTYNPTNREEVVTVQPQGEAKASRMNVPMRTKKKAADQMPAPGREGYVADPKRKQKSFLSHSVHASDEIMDIDGEMACMGLPKDGKTVYQTLSWL